MIGKASSEQKKYKVCLWFFDLLCAVLAFGTFSEEGFGSDTLFHMYQPEISIETWLRSGRLAAWAMSEGLYRAGFSATDHYFLCYVVFLLLWSFALYSTEELLFPLFRGERSDTEESVQPLSVKAVAAVVTVVLIVYLNVFSTEYFMFTECFLVFPFAYFFVSVGILLISRHHNVGGSILFLLGCLYYQVAGLAGMILLGSFYAAKNRYRLSGRLVRKELVISFGTLLCVSAGTLITWLLSRAGVIEPTNKILSHYSLPELMESLFHNGWSLFRNNYELYPAKWVPALMWGIPLIFSLILLLQQKAFSAVVTILLLQVMYLTGASLFAAAGDYWSARVVFPFYSGLGMTNLAVIVILYWKVQYSKNARNCTVFKRIGDLWLMILILFVCSQMVLCNLIGADHRASNTLDLANVNAVLDRIEAYEKETHTEITEVRITYDLNVERYYAGIRYKLGQINERTMAVVPYSLLHLAAAERGRELTNGGDVPAEMYDAYFKGKDWNSLDCDEQLIFLDQTVYWCIF